MVGAGYLPVSRLNDPGGSQFDDQGSQKRAVLRLHGWGVCVGVCSVFRLRPIGPVVVGGHSARWCVHSRGGVCVAGRDGGFCALRLWLY